MLEVTETSVQLSWRANSNHGASPVAAFTVEYFSHETGQVNGGWIHRCDLHFPAEPYAANLLSALPQTFHELQPYNVSVHCCLLYWFIRFVKSSYENLRSPSLVDSEQQNKLYFITFLISYCSVCESVIATHNLTPLERDDQNVYSTHSQAELTVDHSIK